MTRSVAAPIVFRMEATQKAVQAAMAAEIGARLGRMNRSKAWLHRQAEISASAWRHYFTAFDRDVPLGVVQRIAAVLGTTTGELVGIAEDDAGRYVDQILGDLSPGEREKLRRASGANEPRGAGVEFSDQRGAI